MKKVTRMSKNKNKRIRIYLTSILRAFLSLLRNVLELLVYLTVLILKFAYKLVFKFDSIVAKLFMKMSRLERAILIWVLIINVAMNIYQTFNIPQPKIVKKQDTETVAIVMPKQEEKQEKVIEKENTCEFDEISCMIYNKANQLGMSEREAIISIAISRWETGNYTSKAFKEKNNVGGMMCTSGLIHYNSLDEGIEKFLINLKNNYFAIGLDTIDKIKPKYCPDNADNDPNNLNQYWTNGVKKIYNELKNK